jgi:arylsulfatase A-like enzyme
VGSRFGYAQGFDVFRDFLQDFVPPHVEEAEQEKRARGWASRLNRRLIKMRPKMGPFARVYDELYFRYCQQVTPVPASLDAQRCFPSADILVGEAKEWLASTGDEPFFLWIHLMDPHAPYFPKDEALALMGDSLLSPERARYLNSFWHRYDLGPRRLATHRSEIIRLYDAGIRWVDAQVERLIEHLRKAGKWRDCIFALTADHGEEFLEHGGRLHPPAGLMEELIHVPLLLRVPECAKKEVAKGPFSMLHLAPTLLDAAELPIPSSFEGRSHWPQLREGAPFEGIAISECVAGCTNPFRLENRMGARVLSVREARYKLVLHFAPPAEHLYDLDADPEEKTPLGAGEQKPLRKRLLEIARAHLNASTAHRDLRLRSRAQLRDLQLEWKNPAGKPSLVAS